MRGEPLPVARRCAHPVDEIEDRKGPEDFARIDLGQDGVEVVVRGRLREAGLRSRGREHRPDLAPIFTKPVRARGQRQRSALVEPEVSPRAATSLRNHRDVMGILQRRRLQLVFAEVRAAVGAHFSGRPGLRGQPLDRVIAVFGVAGRNDVFPLRLEFSAHILDRDHVALAREPASWLDRPVRVLVVGGAHHDHRKLLREALREVEVGGEQHAIPHRNQHAALDPHRVLRLGRQDGFRRCTADRATKQRARKGYHEARLGRRFHRISSAWRRSRFSMDGDDRRDRL